jgi:DinB superfamily
MAVEYGPLIVEQLEFYWNTHLWPRLTGLTDEEFFWEPVAECWSVRRGPDGTWRVDTARREPVPPPVTTIAWRIVHIAEGMAIRTNTFFASEPGNDHDMHHPSRRPRDVPATAEEGLRLLAREYEAWHRVISSLDLEGFERLLGPRGSYFADHPMIALIVHVNREVMHHGGEVGVLRDLYRAGLR